MFYHEYLLSVFGLPFQVLPVVTVRVQPDPIRGTTVIAIRPIVNVGAMLKIQNLCRCNCIKFMQKYVKTVMERFAK